MATPVALHDVDDVEAFAAHAVRKVLSGNGGYLRPDLREELERYMIETLYAIAQGWRPQLTPSFRLYASFLCVRRGADWYRRTFHDSRSAGYVTVVSLEALAAREPETLGWVESHEEEVVDRVSWYANS